MPEHKARMKAFIDRCRELREGSPNAFYAHVDSFCKVAEALLTAGEDVALQGEPAQSRDAFEELDRPQDVAEALNRVRALVRSEACHIAYLDDELDALVAAVQRAGEASPSRPMAAVCRECGCTTGGGEFCYQHAPYQVWPLKDGTFRCDRNGMKRILLNDPPSTESEQAFALHTAEQQIATLTAELNKARQLGGFLARVDEIVAIHSALEKLPRFKISILDGMMLPRPQPDGGWIRWSEVQALLSPPPPSQETT